MAMGTDEAFHDAGRRPKVRCSSILALEMDDINKKSLYRAMPNSTGRASPQIEEVDTRYMPLISTHFDRDRAVGGINE